MRLRICNGESERTTTASLELVREGFALEPVDDGYEIALADGERWIAAIALRSGPGGESEFLLSGVTGDAAPPTGRVSRTEALHRFQQFMLVPAGD